MRTILALLIGALAAAQTPADIERAEKQIAAHPDNVGDRVNFLRMLTNPIVAMPAEKVRELRRQYVLWLIEHHPDAANIFDQPQLLLPARGRLADPDGAAEAEGLWKELASKAGAKPAVIANAAIYLRAIDLPAALALLGAERTDGPEISRARGSVDAAAVIGLSGLGRNANFLSIASLRESAEAKAAFAEIKASSNPYFLGGAAVVFRDAQNYEIPNDLTFGDEDPLGIAERLLRRAIELAPPGTQWKADLASTLVNKSYRTIDAREKTRQLVEALSLMPDHGKQNVLPALALAEFDANDDAAAERDARLLLDGSTKNANGYHIAQTVMGRVAAAKGDLDQAKVRLIASVTMPDSIKTAVFQPNMTLAQDVYDAGDKGAVIEFLEASRKVWKFDGGRIDRMISFVKKAPSADLVQLSRQFPGSEVLRRPAPAFEARDLDGNTWTREQLTGKVVALEFGHAPLAERVSMDFAARGAVLLQVRDDDTKRRFEVLTDPTVVVIDRQGNVSGYHSGPASEADWRNEFESGFGRGANPVTLPAPKQAEPVERAGGKVTLTWEPVDNAESYVVEWDSRDENGWIFDRDHTVRVIPSRDASAVLDLNGFTRIRWRVYAVPRSGQPGIPSPWRELEGAPVTKIYK